MGLVTTHVTRFVTCDVLHCDVLHFDVLHCDALHCDALHHNYLYYNLINTHSIKIIQNLSRAPDIVFLP